MCTFDLRFRIVFKQFFTKQQINERGKTVLKILEQRTEKNKKILEEKTSFKKQTFSKRKKLSYHR